MKADWAHLDRYRRRCPDPLRAMPMEPNKAGWFEIRRDRGPQKLILRALATVGTGKDDLVHIPWEHVSVSGMSGRKLVIPTWDEMCFIKDLFWDPEECVVQYHPPRSQYVNHNPCTLHLWRPLENEIPLPPTEAV